MPTEAKDPKPKTNIDMRKTKLKASEAAILAGELSKPSWQSKNEGIHERISFEDSIWGFDLAGGSFYKTPLRVTSVKPDSRAEKAGIRPGDKLLRINDIDTSTLTIQEAHEIIIDSGIYLRIAVTAPDDEEDSYFCWQDELQSGYDSDEERRKQEALIKKREVHAKVSSYWSLQWPWVSKRRVIYRESNCFMVPSKFEDKHRDKFPLPASFGPKVLDDIVLNSANAEKGLKLQEEMKSGNAFADATKANEATNKATESKVNTNDSKVSEPKQAESENITEKIKTEHNLESTKLKENGSEHTTEKNNSGEPIETSLNIPNVNVGNVSMADNVENNGQMEVPLENGVDEPDIASESEVSELQGASEESVIENGVEGDADISNSEEVISQNDEILDKMLGESTEMAKDDEETIFNDILNESDAQSSEIIDENQR